MNKAYLVILLFFFISCGDTKAKLSDNKPVDETDFFAAFTKLKLPFSTTDTSLTHLGDTTDISASVLQQFIPDSALTTHHLLEANSTIHPVGKIETKTELYLLAKIITGKKSVLSAFLFDAKHHYLNHLLLLTSPSPNAYTHIVDINTEPTFTITQNKTVSDQYNYTKTGYAYSAESKSFIEVIHDGNEGTAKNEDIINPVDTLAKTFKFSGDYSKDKTNFISVRDGNTPNRYLFFLHFEKNKGECAGELKGYFTMVDATHAVFQQSGDPCVIDFAILTNNSIKVKERGSCGNHRGITCMFDDTYKKKATTQGKKKK